MSDLEKRILGGSFRQMQLPTEVETEDGTTVLMDYLQETDIPEVVALFNEMIQKGDGLARGQLPTEDHMRAYLESGKNVVFRDINKNYRLIGFGNVIKSPLCRSTHPTYHAGYMMIVDTYRRQRVFTSLVHLHGWLSHSEGYAGCLARTVTSSPGAVKYTQSSSPCDLLGLIVDSGHHENYGWVNDIITFYDYSLSIELLGVDNVRKPANVKALPALRVEGHGDSEDLRRAVASKISSLPPNKFTIALASVEEARWLQERIRSAAEKGEGFAMDEFNDDNGQLNRRLFHESVSLVFRRKSAETVEMAPVTPTLTPTNRAGGATPTKGVRSTCPTMGESKASTPTKLMGEALPRTPPTDLVGGVLPSMASPTEPVGGAILGTTSVCRTMERHNMGIYIVVDETNRRQGYGKDILTLCEQLGVVLGYTNAIFDVFVTNIPGQQLAFGSGYRITGQIPKAGQIGSLGLADTVLFYKRLIAHEL